MAITWAALCCVLGSGCASRAQSSAGFTPRFGQSAVVVAHHIPGCTGVRAGPPPFTHSTTGPDTMAGTAATCVIDEHLVAITVWRNAPAHGAAISMIQFGPTGRGEREELDGANPGSAGGTHRATKDRRKDRQRAQWEGVHLSVALTWLRSLAVSGASESERHRLQHRSAASDSAIPAARGREGTRWTLARRQSPIRPGLAVRCRSGLPERAEQVRK